MAIKCNVRWRAIFSLVENWSCVFISGEEFVSPFSSFFAGESADRLSPVLEMELETGIWSRITLSVLVNLMTKKFILTAKNESKTSCAAYKGSYKNTFFRK